MSRPTIAKPPRNTPSDSPTRRRLHRWIAIGGHSGANARKSASRSSPWAEAYCFSSAPNREGLTRRFLNHFREPSGLTRQNANLIARFNQVFRKEPLCPVDLTIRDLATLSNGTPPWQKKRVNP